MSISKIEKTRRAQLRQDELDATLDVIARVFGVSRDSLSAKTRSRADIAFARQAAMYLCRITFELSLAEVGRMFGRDRATVSHACALIEDRRDEEAFDALLSELEPVVRGLCATMRRRRLAGERPHRGEIGLRGAA